MAKSPQLNDPVYDPNDEKPVTRPDLQASEQVSSVPAEQLERIPTMSDEEAAAHEEQISSALQAGKDEEDTPVSEKAETDSAPDNDHENKLGRGYRKPEEKPGFMRRHLRNRNRLFYIGTSGIALALIITVILFFLLSPLKILSFVNNLQSRFFAPSNSIMQREVDVMFSNYVKKYVLPALRNCPGSITKACNPIKGNSMVSELFTGWRNAHLEDTIAKEFGIEFSYNKHSDRYFMKTLVSTNDIDLTDFVDNNPENLSLGDWLNDKNIGGLKPSGRNELRQAYRNSLSTATRWDKLMYRYRVSGLLEKKYGLNRCVIACKTRDNFADWKDDKTRAAKIAITRRVLEPRSDMMAIVLQCIFDGGCDSKVTDSDGRIMTAFDQQVQLQLEALAAKYGAETVEEWVQIANKISNDGYQKYLTDKVVDYLVGKYGGDEAAQEAAKDVSDKALPVIGWVNTAAKILGIAADVNGQIKHYSYVVNAAGMVGVFGTYRVYADEAKTGHVDLAMYGSFVNALGDGNADSAGGTASAEQAPLYEHYINGFNNPVSKTYKCRDDDTGKYDKPLPAGKLICPEESLDASNSTLAGISDFVNKSGLGALANWWNTSPFEKAFGSITGFFGKTFSKALSIVPGYSTLLDYISRAVSPIIKTVVNYLIPSPFSDNMSGGRTADMAIGGADIAGNDFAHNGLGAAKISTAQATAYYTQQEQQELADYKQKPLLARLFSTDTKYSPAVKLAMAMPTGAAAAQADIASVFSNPMHIFSSLGSIFSGGKVMAASDTEDPFGISQYGYLLNDPNLQQANQDPETYWAQNCTTDGKEIDWSKPTNADWQNKTVINPDTGMPENSTTDPCLLIQSAAVSAGALFDSNLLTRDDLDGLSSSASGDSGGTASASGSSQQLAQQILANKNIIAAGTDVLQDLQAAAAGNPGSAGVPTSTAILQLIATVGQSHQVAITAIQSGGDGHCFKGAEAQPKSACPSDPHYNGDAVDFGALDNIGLTGRDAGSITIMKAAFNLLPSGSGFGQSQCGNQYTNNSQLPNGDITFTDACNHLHVQVPAGTP